MMFIPRGCNKKSRRRVSGRRLLNYYTTRDAASVPLRVVFYATRLTMREICIAVHELPRGVT